MGLAFLILLLGAAAYGWQATRRADRRSRERAAALTEAARKLGLRGLYDGSLQGLGVAVRFDPSDPTDRLRIRITGGPRGITLRPAAAFPRRDVQTGDLLFDRAFDTAGEPIALAAHLGPEARNELLKLADTGELVFSEGALEWTVEGRNVDRPRLSGEDVAWLVRRAIRTAEALGSERLSTSRLLLRRVRNEPDPALKLDALAAMTGPHASLIDRALTFLLAQPQFRLRLAAASHPSGSDPAPLIVLSADASLSDRDRTDALVALAQRFGALPEARARLLEALIAPAELPQLAALEALIDLEVELSEDTLERALAVSRGPSRPPIFARLLERTPLGAREARLLAHARLDEDPALLRSVFESLAAVGTEDSARRLSQLPRDALDRETRAALDAALTAIRERHAGRGGSLSVSATSGEGGTLSVAESSDRGQLSQTEGE